MQIKKPMKYEIMPTISGMYLSERLEMSLSVSSLLAQKRIIAMGSMDAKIIDTTSRTINSPKSNPDALNDIMIHINVNNGMQIIGGFVNFETFSAIFNLSIYII